MTDKNLRRPNRVDPVLVTSVLDYLRRSEHGYDLAEMAEHFGVSSGQLLGVIEFLWTLEFPDTALAGHEHMFDFDAEGLYAEEPWVKLVHDPAAKVTRRFEPQELATVLTGLSTLREFRTTEELEVLDRLTAKLLGLEATDAEAERAEHPIVVSIRRATERGTQLEISYVAEDADAPETRVVDPLRIEIRGTIAYLSAYCHLREGMRWFRHDRIAAIRELETTIGEYSERDRNQRLQIRGKAYPRLQVAIAPSAYVSLRPYLEGRDFPKPDADGFSRSTIAFRSLRVAARLAAENPGAFIVEGPADARAFVARWAADALSVADAQNESKA